MCGGLAVVDIDGGTLAITNLPGLPEGTEQPPAEIYTSGNVIPGAGPGILTGLTIHSAATLSMPDDEFNRLYVRGMIDLIGTAIFSLDLYSDDSDQVVASSKIVTNQFSSSAVIDWISYRSDRPFDLDRWTIMESQGGSVGAIDPGNITWPDDPAIPVDPFAAFTLEVLTIDPGQKMDVVANTL